MLVAFCLIDGVFCLLEALQFHEVSIVNPRSYSTSHCCSVQELFPCAHIFESFPTFSSISFSVSGFIWSSLIHLDLTLVQGDRNGLIRILLHVHRKLGQHHLLKMLPGPSKHRSGWSESAIGWITRPPMQELEILPKELKGTATL